jgi:signal transduction histidine kinase
MLDMKFGSQQSFVSLALITALGVVVVVLAVLQYRWSTQVSDAERERLQTTLQTAMNQFREDLHRELASICSAFDINRAESAEQAEGLYAEHYDNWERTAAHRELVTGVYLWEETQAHHAALFRLNPKAGQFEAVDCPSRFGDLCASMARKPAAHPNEPGPPGLPFAWSLRGEIPALVHPAFWTGSNGDDPVRAVRRPAGYVVIELNCDFLQKGLLAELARRYFGGPQGLVYQVAVVGGSDRRNQIYLSEAVPLQGILASADGTLELFGPRHPHPLQPRPEDLPRGEFRFRPENPNPRRLLFAERRALAGPPRGFGPFVILPDLAAARWELVVRHRAGSLSEVVAGMRRRNLGLSFGVLLVLAASVVMIIVWTERAQKLAKLQMDFVTGVSHELRTPVSVICSAAENLADGVANTTVQVEQYGALIRNEGRRLSEMVEQILLFAAARERRWHYDARPLQIQEIIDSTLADSENLIGASGFTVEKRVAPGLPQVLADPSALGQCLRNLITNALKYGVANRWLGIYAQTGVGVQGDEIQVTVQDRGPGIDPGDLPHVFEPFYRGNSARTSQIHGTGLGLSLVKQITEAMGGRLTVMSAPGQGSSFTLHLPVVKEGEQPRAQAG